MAVAHETAARIDRQREGRDAGSELAAHLRERRRPGFDQSGAATARGETKDFISDDLRYRETVVDFRRLDVARVDTRHEICLLGRFELAGKIGCGHTFSTHEVRSV